MFKKREKKRTHTELVEEKELKDNKDQNQSNEEVTLQEQPAKR